jgi:DDE superfamily endonuclease
MEPHHETGFPATLCRWVEEIVQSSPEAARLTVLELIVGAVLASGVTQAILALTPRLGWQAYHWMLERFRLLGLISALCRIVRREIGVRRCFVVIDDTLAPRCSAQAPGVAVRFDHAAKTNRPAFLLSQCFVTLSAVVPCRDRPRSVPLVTGLCRSSGNAGKLAIAKGLLRAVGALGPVCLLLDAWYMRGSLIRTALRLGHEVIGQVRRDTALFALPPPRQPGRRGRSRLYGGRLDADMVAALPASVHAIAGYGGRSARLRHAVCRPRFLRGVIVRVVWCELAKGSGWTRARLLLSTDPTLSAPVEAYSRRWSIEPLFRDLKMVDGLGAMWQRGRIALLRWLHLVQIARTLLVLLTARAEPHALIRLGGWRPAATLTLVKDALAARFRNFEAFRLLPETCRKSGPARHTGPPAIAAAA